MKLSKELPYDERDALDALILSEGFPVLVQVIRHLCARIDDSVLKYDLNRGPDGLVIEKARAEGARRLQSELLAYCKALKQQGDKSSLESDSK